MLFSNMFGGTHTLTLYCLRTVCLPATSTSTAPNGAFGLVSLCCCCCCCCCCCGTSVTVVVAIAMCGQLLIRNKSCVVGQQNLLFHRPERNSHFGRPVTHTHTHSPLSFYQQCILGTPPNYKASHTHTHTHKEERGEDSHCAVCGAAQIWKSPHTHTHNAHNHFFFFYNCQNKKKINSCWQGN